MYTKCKHFPSKQFPLPLFHSQRFHSKRTHKTHKANDARICWSVGDYGVVVGPLLLGRRDVKSWEIAKRFVTSQSTKHFFLYLKPQRTVQTKLHGSYQHRWYVFGDGEPLVRKDFTQYCQNEVQYIQIRVATFNLCFGDSCNPVRKSHIKWTCNKFAYFRWLEKSINNHKIYNNKLLVLE